MMICWVALGVGGERVPVEGDLANWDSRAVRGVAFSTRRACRPTTGGPARSVERSPTSSAGRATRLRRHWPDSLRRPCVAADQCWEWRHAPRMNRVVRARLTGLGMRAAVAETIAIAA